MTLRISQLPLGPIETNAYIVNLEGSNQAVVVDPAADAVAIQSSLAHSDLSCVAIFITHGHWDHLCAVADLADETGATVYMPVGERDFLENLSEHVPPGVTGRSCSPDVLLVGEERLNVAGISFDVLSVPGHSSAHVAYSACGHVFSGDVLFAGSVGRTDLPGADWNTLLASIRNMLETLAPETVVYPGHGPVTTLGKEFSSNPFLGDLRIEPER